MPYIRKKKFDKTSKIFCHFKLQKDVSTELGNLPYSQIFHWSFSITWEVHSFRSETMSKLNKTKLMEIMVNCENVFFK